jgi:L-lactate dehydrogenase complex protein LldG
MSARDAILARVRNALQAPSPAPAMLHAAHRRRGDLGAAERQARFLSRLADYNVNLLEASPDGIAATVAQRLLSLGKRSLAVAPDLDAAWRPGELEVLVDGPQRPYAELDSVGAALTTCACAIAETGTIVLDGGPGQGRRALTLLPDHHICVVLADQVVEIVPEALERLRPSVAAGWPLTFLSGPSATADIEFDRVVGVHGPRTLDVIFLETATPRA